MQETEDQDLFAGVPTPAASEAGPEPVATRASARFGAVPDRSGLGGMSKSELVEYAEALIRECRQLDSENEFLAWEYQNSLTFFSRAANLAHRLNASSLETIVNAAIDEVADHFNCGFAALFVYNTEPRGFSLVRASRAGSGVESYDGRHHEFLAKLFISRSEPYIIDYNPEMGCLEFEDGECSSDDIPENWVETFDTRALVFPLKALAPTGEDAVTLGGLILGDAGGHLEGRDAETALFFADLLSSSLYNARLVEKLNELTIVDPLTHIFNRRHLIAELTREMIQAGRQGHRLSIAMIDIDNFKSFNDKFGHVYGDEVIREVAGVLKRDVREGVDLVARYGGEEFVVLMPFTALENATDVCERLRRKVEERGIGQSRGRFRRVEVGVTCSFGAAQYIVGESVEQFIDRADGAMYRAKMSGRNTVVAAQQE